MENHKPMNSTSTMPPAQNGGHTREKKRRNDFFLVGILLIVPILAGLCFLLLRGEGDTVTVTVNGEVFGTYSLSEDTAVEIRTGKDDTQINRLVIRNGEALMETANCPDGICAAHKPISRDGESIVCLPHKVVVTVRRTQADTAPDVAV
jgi:hypothetical protein